MKRKRLAPKTVATYFMVVSIDWPSIFATAKLTCADLLEDKSSVQWPFVVSQRLPPYDYADFEFDEVSRFFCFPNGAPIKHSDSRMSLTTNCPLVHSFTITRGDSTVVHVTCLTFYDPLSENVRKELIIPSFRSVLDRAKDGNCFATTQFSRFLEDAGELYHSELVWLNFCLEMDEVLSIFNSQSLPLDLSADDGMNILTRVEGFFWSLIEKNESAFVALMSEEYANLIRRKFDARKDSCSNSNGTDVDAKAENDPPASSISKSKMSESHGDRASIAQVMDESNFGTMICPEKSNASGTVSGNMIPPEESNVSGTVSGSMIASEKSNASGTVSGSMIPPEESNASGTVSGTSFEDTGGSRALNGFADVANQSSQYVSSLTVEENTWLEQMIETYYEIRSAVVQGLESLFDIFWAKKMENLYLYEPKSIALLSRMPLYSVFKKILCGFLGIARSNSPTPIPLERSIMHILCEVPEPPAGRYRVRFKLHDDQKDFISFSRPPANRLPLLNTPLRPIFELLSLGNILLVFEALMLESHILFVSDHIHLLTTVASGFQSLLFPCVWQLPYVPVLPNDAHMMGMLESPVGIIAGALREQIRPNDSWMQQVILVDLDNNVVEIGDEHSFLPQEPNGFHEILISNLRKCAYPKSHEITLVPLPRRNNAAAIFSQVHRRMPAIKVITQETRVPVAHKYTPGTFVLPGDELTETEFCEEDLSFPERDVSVDTDENFNNVVRKIFLVFWVKFIGGYRRYIHGLNGAKHVSFDKAAFVRDHAEVKHPKGSRKCLELFLETQMMQDFIDSQGLPDPGDPPDRDGLFGPRRFEMLTFDAWVDRLCGSGVALDVDGISSPASPIDRDFGSKGDLAKPSAEDDVIDSEELTKASFLEDTSQAERQEYIVPTPSASEFGDAGPFATSSLSWPSNLYWLDNRISLKNSVLSPLSGDQNSVFLESTGDQMYARERLFRFNFNNYSRRARQGIEDLHDLRDVLVGFCKAFNTFGCSFPAIMTVVKKKARHSVQDKFFEGEPNKFIKEQIWMNFTEALQSAAVNVKSLTDGIENKVLSQCLDEISYFTSQLNILDNSHRFHHHRLLKRKAQLERAKTERNNAIAAHALLEDTHKKNQDFYLQRRLGGLFTVNFSLGAERQDNYGYGRSERSRLSGLVQVELDKDRNDPVIPKVRTELAEESWLAMSSNEAFIGTGSRYEKDRPDHSLLNRALNQMNGKQFRKSILSSDDTHSRYMTMPNPRSGTLPFFFGKAADPTNVHRRPGRHSFVDSLVASKPKSEISMRSYGDSGLGESNNDGEAVSSQPMPGSSSIAHEAQRELVRVSGDLTKAKIHLEACQLTFKERANNMSRELAVYKKANLEIMTKFRTLEERRIAFMRTFLLEILELIANFFREHRLYHLTKLISVLDDKRWKFDLDGSAPDSDLAIRGPSGFSEDLESLDSPQIAIPIEVAVNFPAIDCDGAANEDVLFTARETCFDEWVKAFKTLSEAKSLAEAYGESINSSATNLSIQLSNTFYKYKDKIEARMSSRDTNPLGINSFEIGATSLLWLEEILKKISEVILLECDSIKKHFVSSIQTWSTVAKELKKELESRRNESNGLLLGARTKFEGCANALQKKEKITEADLRKLKKLQQEISELEEKMSDNLDESSVRRNDSGASTGAICVDEVATAVDDSIEVVSHINDPENDNRKLSTKLFISLKRSKSDRLRKFIRQAESLGKRTGQHVSEHKTLKSLTDVAEAALLEQSVAYKLLMEQSIEQFYSVEQFRTRVIVNSLRSYAHSMESLIVQLVNDLKKRRMKISELRVENVFEQYQMVENLTKKCVKISDTYGNGSTTSLGASDSFVFNDTKGDISSGTIFLVKPSSNALETAALREPYLPINSNSQSTAFRLGVDSSFGKTMSERLGVYVSHLEKFQTRLSSFCIFLNETTKFHEQSSKQYTKLCACLSTVSIGQMQQRARRNPFDDLFVKIFVLLQDDAFLSDYIKIEAEKLSAKARDREAVLKGSCSTYLRKKAEYYDSVVQAKYRLDMAQKKVENLEQYLDECSSNPENTLRKLNLSGTSTRDRTLELRGAYEQAKDRFLRERIYFESQKSVSRKDLSNLMDTVRSTFASCIAESRDFIKSFVEDIQMRIVDCSTKSPFLQPPPQSLDTNEGSIILESDYDAVTEIASLECDGFFELVNIANTSEASPYSQYVRLDQAKEKVNDWKDFFLKLNPKSAHKALAKKIDNESRGDLANDSNGKVSDEEKLRLHLSSVFKSTQRPKRYSEVYASIEHTKLICDCLIDVIPRRMEITKQLLTQETALRHYKPLFQGNGEGSKKEVSLPVRISDNLKTEGVQHEHEELTFSLANHLDSSSAKELMNIEGNSEDDESSVRQSASSVSDSDFRMVDYNRMQFGHQQSLSDDLVLEDGIKHRKNPSVIQSVDCSSTLSYDSPSVPKSVYASQILASSSSMTKQDETKGQEDTSLRGHGDLKELVTLNEAIEVVNTCWRKHLSRALRSTEAADNAMLQQLKVMRKVCTKTLITIEHVSSRVRNEWHVRSRSLSQALKRMKIAKEKLEVAERIDYRAVPILQESSSARRKRKIAVASRRYETARSIVQDEEDRFGDFQSFHKKRVGQVMRTFDRLRADQMRSLLALYKNQVFLRKQFSDASDKLARMSIEKVMDVDVNRDLNSFNAASGFPTA